MSRAESELGKLLASEFKQRTFTQCPIKVGRRTLFLDYYIPQLRIAFETDGRQHDEFVRHFHHTKEGFEDSLKRDALKEEWCLKNHVALIRFKSNERIDVATLRSKIQDIATSS